MAAPPTPAERVGGQEVRAPGTILGLGEIRLAGYPVLYSTKGKNPPRVGGVSEGLGFEDAPLVPSRKAKSLHTHRVLASPRVGPPELRLAWEGGGVGIAEGWWGEGWTSDSPGSATHWL